MKNIFFIALLSLLSACSTIGEFKGANYDGTDAGRVVMGIGEINSPYSSYTFYIRKVGEKESTFLKYSKTGLLTGDKTDYSNDKERGVIESLKLAPGNYEIYNFRLYRYYVSGYENIKSREDFSIPFTIAPHQVTYVGNYQANTVYGKNFFGMKVPAMGVFVVSDREASDIALLKRRYPDEPVAQVINATPTAKSIGNPFFFDANSGLQ